MIIPKQFVIAISVGTTLLIASGCGDKGADTSSPPVIPAKPSTPPVAATEPAAVESVPTPGVPTSPTPGAPPAPGAPAATAPAADELTNYRVDADGKTLSDLQVIQNAVDGYNRNRFNQLEPDSKPGPELQDVSQLVQLRYLPRVPAPPAGKKWALDAKKAKVLLVNQ